MVPNLMELILIFNLFTNLVHSCWICGIFFIVCNGWFYFFSQQFWQSMALMFREVQKKSWQNYSQRGSVMLVKTHQVITPLHQRELPSIPQDLEIQSKLKGLSFLLSSCILGSFILLSLFLSLLVVSILCSGHRWSTPLLKL